MNSQDRFSGFEFMCLARATLAKKEMEYWLAEAEEWKQLKELPEPFVEEKGLPNTRYSEPNYR